METQTTTPPVNTTQTVTPAPRPYRPQSRSHAERLARAEATIRRVQGSSELNTRLAAQGFTAERLATGDALRQATQDAFTARQQAMGAQREAIGKAEKALTDTREHFADFRIRVRQATADIAVHTLLDLDTSMPYDTYGLMYMAKNTYATATKTSALQSLLDSLGYDAAALQGLQTELQTVGTLLQAADEARANAVRATLERERAVSALDRWVRILRAAARPATRGRPDLKMQMEG